LSATDSGDARSVAHFETRARGASLPDKFIANGNASSRRYLEFTSLEGLVLTGDRLSNASERAMIDKDELRSFLGFLDTASDRELQERDTLYKEAIGLLASGDARRDYQFLQRKLNEERIARLNLRWLHERRKAHQG